MIRTEFGGERGAVLSQTSVDFSPNKHHLLTPEPKFSMAGGVTGMRRLLRDHD